MLLVHGKSAGYCAPPITNRRWLAIRAGLDQEPLQRVLTVRRIRAEIGKIGRRNSATGAAGRWIGWIHATVKWRNTPRI